MAEQQQQMISQSRVRFARRGLLLLLAVVVLLVGLFYAPLMRLVARPLIAADELVAADYVWVFEGDHCFDRAAELVKQGTVKRILVVEEDPKRLTALGIVPGWADISLRELDRRGLSAEQITVLRQAGRNRWQWAETVDDWLADQEPLILIALCDRFDSHNVRLILRRRLLSAQLQGLAILALPDRRYDEATWWQSRTGIKALLNAYYSLIYDWTLGEPADVDSQWDPAEYERELQRQLSAPTNG